MTGPLEVPREAEAAIERFVTAVRQAFGSSLRSVILYGSAASGEYVPGRSDLNFALVLDDISLEALGRCRRHLKTWRKDGVALPLLLTPQDIQRSADVFPIEFLDICEHHILLTGEDFFADLQVDPRNLRFQVEHELKAKLLALRQAYLAGLDRVRPDVLVEELLSTSVPAFLTLGRNLLRVASRRPPARRAETPAALERAFGLRLPTFTDLVSRRQRGAPLEAGEGVARLARYLAEIESLASVADERTGAPDTRAPAHGPEAPPTGHGPREARLRGVAAEGTRAAEPPEVARRVLPGSPGSEPPPSGASGETQSFGGAPTSDDAGAQRDRGGTQAGA